MCDKQIIEKYLIDSGYTSQEIKNNLCCLIKNNDIKNFSNYITQNIVSIQQENENFKEWYDNHIKTISRLFKIKNEKLESMYPNFSFTRDINIVFDNFELHYFLGYVHLIEGLYIILVY